MKILQTQTLHGPNYWSISRSKLILVQLDLGELADRSSNTLLGFYDGLAAVLPSLKEHVCLPGCRGGFLSEVQKGTTMGQILVRVALELQTLADMPVGFGRTHETSALGIYRIVIEYQVEEAGRYATRAALRLCQRILETGTYPKKELKKDLDDLAWLRTKAALGATTDVLVREAENRGIPWTHLESCDLFQLGYGKYQKRVQAALTSHGSVLGVELACNKQQTKKILDRMGVPVPLGVVIYAFRELEETINRLGGYPVVIKPLDGNHGRGITINVQSWEHAEVAYDHARDVSSGVIVEHFYQGRDHRILVVNHKVVAVAERVPAHVVGNGIETIATLVEQENQDIRRGEGHDNMLTHIELDDATDEMLNRQGFTLDTILSPDQVCYLRATANLSTGGIAIDRTDEIHRDTVWLAERVSRIIDLDIAGIDVVTTDISKPLSEADGVIVEVNAAPGLRMHVSPSQGVGRNVAAPILNMLFPPGMPTRIPIVAVTGTNGKTSPMPLIAHIFSQVYQAVGFTTTDDIYISNHRVKKGDPAQLQQAHIILQDPTVDIAVLETGRDEILNSGLAFQYCDVGVVLNVVADQLGLKEVDLNVVNQMARVNAVVVQTVHPDGYAVLNADDEQAAAMAGQVVGKVAYFSMDSENPLVRSHVQRGGIAAVYETGHLSILQEGRIHQIEHVERISFTLSGCAPYRIAQALAASLAAFVQGVSMEQIRMALHSFNVSAGQSSGQLNLFNLDYYHCDQLQKYSDFKGEQISTQGELRLQPALLQPSVPYPRHSNQNLKIQAHLFREKDLEEKLYSGAEGDPIRQSVNGHHRFDAQTAVQTQISKATTIASALNRDRKVDFPKLEATLPEPLQLQKVAVQDSIELAQKNQTTFTKPLKQRNFKVWVADQNIKVKNWAKKQAPVLKQVTLSAVKKTAEQAFDIGEILLATAIAFGRVTAHLTLEKGKELGEIAWEKFEKATQLVNPATLDPALKEIMLRSGKDGKFINELFIFQHTPTGVDVHLKDGTPVYIRGKLNPKVDGRFIFLLSKIPENGVKIQSRYQQTADGSRF
jgi:cyanophycin synthetase